MSDIISPELTRSEQAWAKNISKRIGSNLFKHKIRTSRKNDIEQIYDCLCEILIGLKRHNSSFDIDILNMQEAKTQFSPQSGGYQNTKDNSLVIHSQKAENEPNFYELFYKNCTEITTLGIITGDRKFKASALKGQRLKKKLQDAVKNIYNVLVKETNPLHSKFDKEKYNKLVATRKAKYDKSFLDCMKWGYSTKHEEDLVLILNNKEYKLSAYSTIETDKFGNSYKIISPIVNSQILNLFAQDESKEAKNLHDWLKHHIKFLKDKVVIADIEAKLDSRQDGNNYRGLNLSESRIVSLDIKNVDCRYMILRDCNIFHLHFNQCYHEGIDLRGADVRKVMVTGSREVTALYSREKSSQISFENEIDRDKHSHIILSVADINQAKKHHIISESLYEVLGDRVSLDPFYVRGNGNQYFALDNLYIKAEKLDLENYLEEISKLQVVRDIKLGHKRNIDWTHDEIPTFVEFMAKKLGEVSSKKHIYIDLTNQDLSAFNLMGGNYRNVNFSGCKISYGSHANFCGSCLEGVIAKNADFSYSIFIQANMQYISAKGANFANANMNEANLVRAKLVDIRGQFQACRANMSFANCEGAEIDHSDLSFVHAEGTNFTNIHANYCNIVGAKMRHAILSGGSFIRTNFSRSILNDTVADYANLKGANLIEVQAKGVDFTHAVLQNIHGENINLAFAILYSAKVEQTILEGASMQYIKACNASFEKTYMKNADLKFADLRGVNFNKANLGNVNINDANISNSNMGYTNLWGITYNHDTNLLGLENINTAHVEQKFQNMYEKQNREAFPLEHMIKDINYGYKNIKAVCTNIAHEFNELIKYNIAYGRSGAILGISMAMGIEILICPAPTAVLVICMGVAMISSMIGLDAIISKNYLKEIINLEQSSTKLRPEYVTEQTIFNLIDHNRFSKTEFISKNNISQINIDKIKETLSENNHYPDFTDIEAILDEKIMSRKANIKN